MGPFPSVLWVGYVAVFAGAGLVCVLSLRRIDLAEDPDTRRGLAWFLGLTAGWAFAHVGYLLAPTPTLQYACFVAGLVIGIAAVGPWLYFCSAYTGRSLHRNRAIRRTVVGIFVLIVLVKVTNPLHGWYFSSEAVTEPFPYLAIHHGAPHWIVMGLAYALAAVGLFMLFELFLEVSYDTGPLLALVGLTGLPVVFDLGGVFTPYLLDVTHSPIGVAAFAVGVLYAFVDRFQAVQRAGDVDDPVLLLDEDGRLLEWNDAAVNLFPAIRNARRESLEAVEPRLAEAVGTPSQVLTFERDDTTRYYRVTTNPFSTDHAQLGAMVTLTDVSEHEEYRRRLERQNERLEEFASIVSHDLRNPLNVAEGRLELAEESGEDEHFAAVRRAHDRMRALIADLLSLARAGMQIDETSPVALAEIATASWEMIEASAARLEVACDASAAVHADRERLRQLLENLFRNAVEHGGADVTVTVGVLPDRQGIYVADDGAGIPPAIRDRLFEPGATTREDGTGFGLAIVADIVRAHGWEISATESQAGGARFEITGIPLDTGAGEDA